MMKKVSKNSLSTKTKIAAWILIISGILGILNIGAYGFYMTPGPGATPLGTSWALTTVLEILMRTSKFLSFFAFILI
jgi:hypothetical protein